MYSKVIVLIFLKAVVLEDIWRAVQVSELSLLISDYLFNIISLDDISPSFQTVKKRVLYRGAQAIHHPYCEAQEMKDQT